MEKTQITPYDIEAGKFIKELALQLKAMPEFKRPEWTLFVKTSSCKERPPSREDWWHIRAASILRQLYLNGLLGVGKLRVKYGSRKNRGMKPEKFTKASGKIIRVILQQATKAGLVEHIKEKKAGRRLTKKGKLFLDSIASQISQTK